MARMFGHLLSTRSHPCCYIKEGVIKSQVWRGRQAEQAGFLVWILYIFQTRHLAYLDTQNFDTFLYIQPNYREHKGVETNKTPTMTNGNIDPSGSDHTTHPLENLTNEQVLQLATLLRLPEDIDPSQTGIFPQAWWVNISVCHGWCAVCLYSFVLPIIRLYV